MKGTIAALMLAAITLLPASAADNLVRRTVKVNGGFDEIEVSKAITVNYTDSKTTAVTLTAPSDIIDEINITRRGNTLKITSDEQNINGKRYNDYQQVKVTVAAPGVKEFAASSAASIIIDRINAPGAEIEFDASSAASISCESVTCREISADASSASSISLSGIVATTVDADASSSASISLSGRCDEVDLDASSTAKISAGSLNAKNGSADASSLASVTCNVSGNLEIDKSTGGSVKNNN